jgi:hypothetical protein
MDQAINKFIKHTIVNLQGALEKQEEQLTLAVLVNLEGVIDSYIVALEDSLDNPPEMSDLYDSIGQKEKSGTA